MVNRNIEPLNARSRETLALLIEAYTATGEPVGSKAISKLLSEGLSAATVRTIIADLEEAGYLQQPHTSAGRVPSDKGYRFYVDHILKQIGLSSADETAIQHGLFRQPERSGYPSADQLMTRASQILSYYSQSVGIVISPAIAHDIIKHIDFVRLGDGRILVITVSRAGLVQDRLVGIDEDLRQDDLNTTANYVNANFSGLSLIAIRAELLKRVSEEQAIYDRLLQNAIMLCEGGLGASEGPDAEVFIEGTSQMVAKRDFNNAERVSQLLRVFEEKSRLIKILNECLSQSPSQSTSQAGTQPLAVRIGSENSLDTLRGCTLITSSYALGDQITGSIGIVGPVRMEYARTIGVVNYIARLLEQALNESPGEAA